MFAVHRAAIAPCIEADQDNPFPLYSASSAWLLRAGRVKVVRSNRSALRLCASFLVVGSVALSTFALTVASIATNVKIELPRPFVFPSGIVHGRRKGSCPTVRETIWLIIKKRYGYVQILEKIFMSPTIKLYIVQFIIFYNTLLCKFFSTILSYFWSICLDKRVLSSFIH